MIDGVRNSVSRISTSIYYLSTYRSDRIQLPTYFQGDNFTITLKPIKNPEYKKEKKKKKKSIFLFFIQKPSKTNRFFLPYPTGYRINWWESRSIRWIRDRDLLNL